MKALISLFQRRTPAPEVVHHAPVSPEKALRDKAYREAYKAIRDLSTQPGVQLPTEIWRLELMSEGIVDGWLVADNYDPSISMDHIVAMTHAADNDSKRRYKDIWDKACAELDGRDQRRNGTSAAIAVGHDAAPFRTTLGGVNAILYGHGVGLGVAIGWATRAIPKERRHCAPAIRPLVNDAIAKGRYAKPAT